ncbi:hypothetical protein [Paraferrimonas sedimenticola]|uniref:Uncharacterized protein n=1 Tax=Paraferrimonas sedimenticola TaxID=375674 RepID=A0AA37RUP9_9GAMM|nr:hypothetical protein [Paraferrimonas sedimenticola]GLP95601.1 hypothetical protein GCM10007895_09070 [Paraferrimonas sedimenticola]
MGLRTETETLMSCIGINLMFVVLWFINLGLMTVGDSQSLLGFMSIVFIFLLPLGIIASYLWSLFALLPVSYYWAQTLMFNCRSTQIKLALSLIYLIATPCLLWWQFDSLFG